MNKDISREVLKEVANFLLAESRDGKLPRGTVPKAVATFKLCRSSIYNIWGRMEALKKAGQPLNLASRRFGKTRKKMLCDHEMIKLIPFHKRKTMRDLASSLGMSKTTVWRWKIKGLIRAHTNAIKPFLTTKNMFSRLKFCLSSLMFDPLLQKVKFKNMDANIHMDEKWFFLTKCTQRYYTFPGEEEPYRTCQSKRFITKVMFNCAVSRPIYSSEGELLFDGKIGMWPFTKKEKAKRSSKHRKAGTWITKPIETVNKEVTRDMLINKVIPAIQKKWPPNATKNINIQWDNATPHISNDDPEFRAAASSNGFNINLVCQPSNSPDTNINDLGYFRSIQSLKNDVQPKTVDELVKATLSSFQKLHHKTLNKVFMSLQGCLIETMKVKGGNNYNLPHLKKDSLHNLETSALDLEVEMDLVKTCLRYLKESGNSGGLEELMSSLDI